MGLITLRQLENQIKLYNNKQPLTLPNCLTLSQYEELSRILKIIKETT